MAELDTYLSNLAGLVANARQGLTAAAPQADSSSLLDSVPQVQTPVFVPRGTTASQQAVESQGYVRPQRGAATSLASLGGLSLSPAEQWIIQHESGGNVNAWNPTAVVDRGTNMGHAFGLGQLVDTNRQSYARQLGIANPNTTDPNQQLAMMRLYIRSRYGTAENAQRFWQSNGWY